MKDLEFGIIIGLFVMCLFIFFVVLQINTNINELKQEPQNDYFFESPDWTNKLTYRGITYPGTLHLYNQGAYNWNKRWVDAGCPYITRNDSIFYIIDGTECFFDVMRCDTVVFKLKR